MDVLHEADDDVEDSLAYDFVARLEVPGGVWEDQAEAAIDAVAVAVAQRRVLEEHFRLGALLYFAQIFEAELAALIARIFAHSSLEIDQELTVREVSVKGVLADKDADR